MGLTMKKKFCVCLSHDVDRTTKTFQFFTHFLRHALNGELGRAAYQIKSVSAASHYWCFDRVMELERKLGVKSVFFFLNETYPFHPLTLSSWRLSLGYYDLFDPGLAAVIRELDGQGWEVGLHGSYLSYKDSELLKREKADLESIVGHPVVGVRQHYLNLDQHTWARQAEAGFSYDASFGSTTDIGFKDDRYHPFKPISDRDFYVVPLALMDRCVMDKEDSLQQATRVIDLAAEKRACLVLNWHQERLNEKEFPGYTQMYLRLIQECMSRKAHFCTIGEYINEMS
jgi:peptidoglycan/xylan/chitin deacetylase (PgdA/CDA1 family)